MDFNFNFDSIVSTVVYFLHADYPYAPELQSFWMAFQACMAVRLGPNKKNQMAGFHAFVLSALSGYGGAMFGSVWMGRPTSMFSNDLNLASVLISFFLVNYLPFDLGFKIGKTFPVVLVTTVFAQLFRSQGVVKFTTIAYDAFKDSPSDYYPIPVFGPIMNGVLLGNMTGFFLKGMDTYLKKGMPWPFQNGLFCASFYHFYVHDTTGPIGAFLHDYTPFPAMQNFFGIYDDAMFAVVFVGVFMQIMGVMQIPTFFGPSFSPFHSVHTVASKAVSASNGTYNNGIKKVATKAQGIASPQANGSNDVTTKKGRNRNKKNK